MELIVSSVREPLSGGESGTQELRHLVHVGLEKEETVPLKMIFSFSQDLGERRLDGGRGIYEKLKTVSVNWIQRADIWRREMLQSA